MSTVRAILRAPFTGRAWRELLYALISMPLSLVALAYVIVAGLPMAILAVTRAGPRMEAVGLRGARRLSDLYRELAARLLHERVASPAPAPPGRAAYDPAGYRAFGYLAVKLPLGLATLYAVSVTWGWGFVGLTYPIQLPLRLNDVKTVAPDGGVRHGFVLGDVIFDTWQRSLLVAAGGAVLLLVAPWAVRLIASLDLLLIRTLLGPNETERIRDLEETRALAVDDAVATLRRIERDLHDGAQVRLISLVMNLAMMKETLPPDVPEATRNMVAAAEEEARGAIGELRELVRGIHPPVLDKGLDVALATLGARSAVPVELDTHLPERPSAAIESIAYFCVAELLANVAKHAEATQALVSVVAQGGTNLRVRVTDDGRGGAALGAGTGLTGLLDRIRPVDGRLDIQSPPGGPTVVTVDLPLPAAEKYAHRDRG
ncbi:sensor domain-containing protein [Actinomadura barringtoniae]|uniref:histidine kinase n=1 Tax=Actinomadura barringtoniae TaxID=1427535 RepID=A0A939PRG2_9ACTN|nr:sensor histidine kinase [Actinomadura barringtoniae]MBO2454844.1 sensor domain-containing protein [Actinomadura barringtoniae]